MTSVGILRAARTAIAKPERWRKGDPSTPDEVTFTALSALEAVVGAGLGEIELVAGLCGFDDALDCGWCVFGLRAFCESYHAKSSLLRWNDLPRTTHGDVVALFDRAIAQAEANDRELDTLAALQGGGFGAAPPLHCGGCQRRWTRAELRRGAPACLTCIRSGVGEVEARKSA